MVDAALFSAERKRIAVIVDVESQKGGDLPLIPGAGDFGRSRTRLVQSRHQHAGQNGDDRDYD
ncbi:MAG: hypothetical protein L6W00_03715 [Lentisphaeria bacterium]|nr:MAG: hypothetical protein L6W00_03715 [Lentisphaeria bacterium]